MSADSAHVRRIAPAQRGRSAPPSPDRRSAVAPESSLAASQLGVVTRAQLVAAGLSPSAVDRRVRSGRLHRLHAGVYAVGHRALRVEGDWLAAVLACGAGAALSHRTAAEAWGIRDHTRRALVDVTVAGSAGLAQRSLTAHRGRLAEEDVVRHRGVPVTTPARTLLDLAEVVPVRELDQALERCRQMGLFDAAAVAAVIARGVGRHGLRPLRAALAAGTEPVVLRSELERRTLALVRASGLPMPVVNIRIHGYEVDLLWERERLVVELDGYAFHSSPGAFEADRGRDADLLAAGYRVLRVTWRRLVDDPGWVVARLSTLLGASDERRWRGRATDRRR